MGRLAAEQVLKRQGFDLGRGKQQRRLNHAADRYLVGDARLGDFRECRAVPTRLGDYKDIRLAALVRETRQDVVQVGDIAENPAATHLATGQIAIELHYSDHFARRVRFQFEPPDDAFGFVRRPEEQKPLPVRVRPPAGHPDPVGGTRRRKQHDHHEPSDQGH